MDVSRTLSNCSKPIGKVRHRLDHDGQFCHQPLAFPVGHRHQSPPSRVRYRCSCRARTQETWRGGLDTRVRTDHSQVIHGHEKVRGSR